MKKNILSLTVFSMLLFTGVANANVQIIQQMPQRPNPLGQALGEGLGKFAQRQQAKKQQQKQAWILSRALSGQATPEEMAQLDPSTQLEVAKIMQMRSQNDQ